MSGFRSFSIEMKTVWETFPSRGNSVSLGKAFHRSPPFLMPTKHLKPFKKDLRIRFLLYKKGIFHYAIGDRKIAEGGSL